MATTEEKPKSTNTWIKVDQEKNPYFYNFVTKQTCIRKPVEYLQDERKLSALKKQQKVIFAEKLDEEWMICIDNFSNWFWFNSKSRASTWLIPEELSRRLLSQYHKVKAEKVEKVEKVEDDESNSRILPNDTWIIVDNSNRETISKVEDYQVEDDHVEDDEFEFDIDDQISSQLLPNNQELKQVGVQVGPTEEQVEEYHNLLDELKVDPFALYETILPNLQLDPRFIQLNSKVAKSLFDKYCKEKSSDIRPKSHSELFLQLLHEQSPRPGMRWQVFARENKRDSRLRNMNVKEAEKMFKRYIDEKTRFEI